MEKLKKLNIDIFLPVIIINLILFIISYGRFGMFFVDTSREVYIPMAMNNGYMLYADIFNIYTPFGYQLNAFLLNIFGENLNTFYFAGFVNSILILYGLYLILNLFIKEKSI